MKWDVGIEKDSAAYRFAADESNVIRVVAGPGTGKTFGLKRRVARLLEQGHDPRKILVVTFTRTAAQDLKNEIQSTEIEGVERVVAKTLHGFCFGLLNKEHIIENTGRYPRPLLDFETKPMLYDLGACFGKLRDKRKKLNAFQASWARLQTEEPGFPHDKSDKCFERELLLWLKQHKAMLFGEMIIETFHYLKNNPLCIERQEFDHVLVDEYQDLNRAEQEVINYLAASCNLAIIGDDDQSIYSFKHAHPDGIREFPEKHPKCNIIDFDMCRRCPKQVVAMASCLISKNPNRTLGDLNAYDKNQLGDIAIIQWSTLTDEINGICKKVHADITSGKVAPEDILILAPVRKIGYRVRNKLVELGINAKSYFRENAISTDNQKRKFALMTMLAKPTDIVALRFLLGFGSQDFRTRSYSKLRNYASNNDLEILEVLDKCLHRQLNVAGITNILAKYSEIAEELARMKSILEEDYDALVDLIADDQPENIDLRNILLDAIAEADEERTLGLEHWLQKVHSYAVERISFPEDTTVHDHVRIMSLHASKGLSANYVVVMSVIDELLPRIDRDDELSVEKQIEEQRRLFYVAITRCKSNDFEHPGVLIISSFTGLPGNYACQIGISANPSSFRRVSASRFIRDFEGTAPQTTVPS